jgi:uncharacterized cofD-like protein
MSSPSAVALGGGHGLSASLRALRALADDLTAVVTVGDDGGSSGVLRRELGVLPPGDLRMALAALGGTDEHARRWAQVVQHRFARGSLAGHPVGNVVLTALLEILGDPVEALAEMAELTGAQGRVLPMAVEPVDLVAQLADPRGAETSGGEREVRGQVAVATTPGHVLTVRLDPPNPVVCPEAVQAVLDADLVVLGPGSWFTSVVPHLLVPELRVALEQTAALKVVTLNLVPQPGETHGFTPQNHLEVLSTYAPDLRVDAVIADPALVSDPDDLREVAHGLGAQVHLATVADPTEPGVHAPLALAAAYEQVWRRGRIRP